MRLQALAERLRPAAVAAYQAALASALTGGAEKRKRFKEAALRSLSEGHQRWQMYAAGVEWMKEDEAAHAVLQRHLVRSTGEWCRRCNVCLPSCVVVMYGLQARGELLDLHLQSTCDSRQILMKKVDFFFISLSNPIIYT